MPLLKQSLLTCLRGAGRTLDMLTNTMLFGAAISLCAIISAIIFEVVARFVFLSPTYWVSDLVVYLLLVTVFLAMPKVTAEAGHVSISIVPEILPGGVSAPVRRVVLFIAAATTVTLAVLAGIVAARQFASGTMTMGAFPVPRFALTATMCFGFGVASLHFLRSSFVRA